MITNLKLKHFQLFKDTEIILDKLNVITGENKDSEDSSSNGSGKSTIGKSAITFCLYGDVAGINLKDLVSFGQKEASVELTFKHGNDVYRIIRKIKT
jgi:exonuclease SbcC